MSFTQDPDPRNRLPGETSADRDARVRKIQERNDAYAPGGHMSTRNADGSSRGGAASMFENYGFF